MKLKNLPKYSGLPALSYTHLKKQQLLFLKMRIFLSLMIRISQSGL